MGTYRLFARIAPGGVIEASMLSPDLLTPPPGFIELPEGPWWSAIAGGGGDRWYYDDGPKPRAEALLVPDRAEAPAGERVRVRVRSARSSELAVSVGGELSRVMANEDVLVVTRVDPGPVTVVVVDPRFVSSQLVLEFV